MAFRQLTGMPVVSYNSEVQSADQLFKIISEADKKKWVMAASCMKEHASLITGHVYSLIGAHVLSNGVKLIKVRNPHG